MMNKKSINKELELNTTEGGSNKLSEHVYLSPALNVAKAKRIIEKEAVGSGLLKSPGLESDSLVIDHEAKVLFRMNSTGNIFFSLSTEMAQLGDEARSLFGATSTLFAAITKAMANKGKSLFDYEAYSKLLRKSGYFVEIQRYSKNINIKKNSLTIDTQIIQDLLPGLQEGPSMNTVKSVLNAMNGEFSAKSADSTEKKAHLLFICEELFGMAMVTVRLLYASKESHKTVTSSPCHKTSSVNITQIQEGNTFLYVDPSKVEEFANILNTETPEFDALAKTLESLID